MTCAVPNGNCGMIGSSLIFCAAGQYCGADNKCTNLKNLNEACNPDAQENECAQGSCVSNGMNFVCQIYAETLPGNPCKASSECWYSENVDGSGSGASFCDDNICRGKRIGETCVASHQCFVGSFCSAAGTCQALGAKDAACSDDSQCGSRFTCFNNKCSTRYTQNKGDACASTENCKDGLYCKAGTCSAMKTNPPSKKSCAIKGTDCDADEECVCQGFQTPSQTATCSNIQGTWTSLPAMESEAFACLDRNGCGSDMANTSHVNCITEKCTKEYCSYFTRASSDLFDDTFPTCLVSRMVGSQDFFGLIKACAPYKPSPMITPPTNAPVPTNAPAGTTGLMNSASSLSVSFFLAAAVAFVFLF